MTPDALQNRLTQLRLVGAGVTDFGALMSRGELPRSPVQLSRELERVIALPRRGPWTTELREEIRSIMTNPFQPEPALRLRDVQCDALLAALEVTAANVGLFAAITVGGGKTLISALLGTVWNCKRPVMLTTAALAAQAKLLISDYRLRFWVPEGLVIVPYSKLSHADYAYVLQELEPDCIIADEAHALVSKDSARGKRIRRYLKSRPTTKVAILTGTIARRSLMEWAELAGIALRDWSPAPRDRPTRREWAGAVDLDAHRPVGALTRLVGVPEAGISEPLVAVRAALARRVAESRAVVCSPAEAVDVPLVVRVVKLELPESLRKARAALDATWCRPDGEELVTAMEHAEVDRQLRLGGYYAWSTEPDRDWLYARKMYRRAVRLWLSDHPRNPIDSPERLERAIMRGEVELLEYEAWADARATGYQEPPREWRWIDQAVAEWGAGQLNGIAFGQRAAFARRVAELAGAPYFGRGPEAAQEILNEKGDRPVVVSLGAHGQGRNLQMFSQALVLDPPPAGATWEQMLGRLHRPGQTAERVVYTVPSTFGLEVERALREAEWLEVSTGLPQKLVSADVEGDL